jgi:hypothetical protein
MAPTSEQNRQKEERAELRRDRRMRGRIAQFLEFADVMALLMVAATAFTALATWRTASIARSLYLSAERPYIGVKKVSIDHTHSQRTLVLVQYQNFGAVPAEDTLIGERLMIDGRPLAGQSPPVAAGIISPQVPHQLQVRLDDSDYETVAAGKSQLVVEVRARYHGPPGKPLCYFEKFRYIPEIDGFEVSGGSPRCEDQGE